MLSQTYKIPHVETSHLSLWTLLCSSWYIYHGHAKTSETCIAFSDGQYSISSASLPSSISHGFCSLPLAPPLFSSQPESTASLPPARRPPRRIPRLATRVPSPGSPATAPDPAGPQRGSEPPAQIRRARAPSLAGSPEDSCSCGGPGLRSHRWAGRNSKRRSWGRGSRAGRGRAQRERFEPPSRPHPHTTGAAPRKDPTPPTP